MMFAFLTTDREWPWRDEDLLGWPGLAVVGAILVVLTLWTYFGQRKVGWNRLAAILGLRLGALAVVPVLLVRPSFAHEVAGTVVPDPHLRRRPGNHGEGPEGHCRGGRAGHARRHDGGGARLRRQQGQGKSDRGRAGPGGAKRHRAPVRGRQAGRHEG